MKRKFLAVVITSAMVASAMQGVVTAAEDNSGEQTVQDIEEITEEIHDNINEDINIESFSETDASAIEKTEGLSETDNRDESQMMQAQLPTDTGSAEEINSAVNQPEVIDTQQELTEAIAQGGEIDLTGQTIELTSALYINNDVVIKGGTLVGTDSVNGNLVTLTGSKVTLEGVTIRTSAGNKSALHVYGTSLTVNGLTIDHSSAAGGAPIIINNGAEAVFRGAIALTLGNHSWYGINVDNAKADFSGAVVNMTPVTATQSVICSEGDNASVTGAGLTVVVTEKDGGANQRQTAYVADTNLAQFVKAKTEAGADVSLIELNKDVTMTAPLVISEAMTVRSTSGRYIINGSDVLGAENVVTITAEGAALENVGIRTSSANKSALHVYRVSARLKNVTLDNQQTAGGAGMIVNGGTVTVEGELSLLLGENSWGGINVDTKNGAAGVTFADGSSVKMTGSDQDVIYIDEDNDADQMTIIGAENAGLAQDADGNYIIAGQDGGQDPEPEQPGDEEDGQNQDDGDSQDTDTTVNGDETADGETTDNDDKSNDTAAAENNMRKAPQTGDNSTGFYLALTALLGSGAAAGTVLKKRRERAE